MRAKQFWCVRVASTNCVSLPRQLFARRALDIAEEVATGGRIDFRETVIFLSLTIGMTFAVRRIWWIAVDGWWMRRLFFFRDATESLPLFLEYFIKRFGQRRSLITSKSWVIEEEKEASEPLRWIIARFSKWDSRFAKFSFRGKRFDFFQDERFSLYLISSCSHLYPRCLVENYYNFIKINCSQVENINRVNLFSRIIYVSILRSRWLICFIFQNNWIQIMQIIKCFTIYYTYSYT